LAVSTYLGAIGMMFLTWFAGAVVYILYKITAKRSAFTVAKTEGHVKLFVVFFVSTCSALHLTLIIGYYWPVYQDQVIRTWLYGSGIFCASYMVLVPIGINPLLAHIEEIVARNPEQDEFKVLLQNVRFVRTQCVVVAASTMVPNFLFASVQYLTRQVIWIYPAQVMLYTGPMMLMAQALTPSKSKSSSGEAKGSMSLSKSKMQFKHAEPEESSNSSGQVAPASAI